MAIMKLHYIVSSAQMFVISDSDIIKEEGNKIECSKLLTVNMNIIGTNQMKIHINKLVDATVFYDVKAAMDVDDPIYKSAYQFLTGLEIVKA